MAWSFGQVVCGHADDRAEHGYCGFAIVGARLVLLIETVRRMLEVREILGRGLIRSQSYKDG
jgi:hypothetical protein